MNPRVAALCGLAALAAGCMPPSWGASAMLHPYRRPLKKPPARAFEAAEWEGAGIRLKGWRFRGEGPVRRGTVIYLHGLGDNRGYGARIADHFVPLGFDVVAYDSRAHGESGGEACTYGYYEKQDLARVIEQIERRPVVLMGSSLGAAVALQGAAHSKDVAAVIAVATFSDLRTAGRERAPFFASAGNVAEAFRIAEERGRFRVDEASPLAAAARIKAPVLVIHGQKDDETPPDHSERVFQSLAGPKRLVLVPGAGHNNAMNTQVWATLDDWLRSSVP